MISGLLKITLFWNKGHDVITPVDDVTRNKLSRDSIYIVDEFMWPKFGNSRISVKEVITTSILSGFDQKNRIFERWSWLKFNNLKLALSTNLKFWPSVAKGLKLKVRKFGRLNPTFVKVIWEKLVGRLPWLLPILNKVKQTWSFQVQVCLSISYHLVDTMP